MILLFGISKYEQLASQIGQKAKIKQRSYQNVMSDYIYPIIAGVIAGVATRLYMLKTDYRQYPTYIHGKVIHIALGLIAAGLGAIIMPALCRRNLRPSHFNVSRDAI